MARLINTKHQKAAFKGDSLVLVKIIHGYSITLRIRYSHKYDHLVTRLAAIDVATHVSCSYIINYMHVTIMLIFAKNTHFTASYFKSFSEGACP